MTKSIGHLDRQMYRRVRELAASPFRRLSSEGDFNRRPSPKRSLHRLATRHLPQTHRMIPTSRHQESTIGRKGETGHIV